MMKLRKFSLSLIGLLCLLCLLCLSVSLHPAKGFAHSTLINAVPAESSSLSASPPQIILTFNERLEKELYAIKVMDTNDKSVTANKAVMSLDQTKVMLSLPALPKGTYTVSYKIISADGHPVGGSYVFTFGHTVEGEGAPQTPAVQIGGGLTTDITYAQVLLLISRIVFYSSFLGLIGWIFWVHSYKTEDMEIRLFDRKRALFLQRILLLSLLLMIYTQALDMLDDWQWHDVASLFFSTNVGISWLVTLGLSLIGFGLLLRSKLFDSLWVLLMLAAKVANGHAMSFSPRSDMIVFDFLHLLFASVWVGGLLYIVFHWRKYHNYTLKFIPLFSRYALISLVFLTISGTLYALGILPKISYVLYSQWGILLLSKIGLVVLVFASGGILRYFMKKNREKSLQRMFKMDVSLMILILTVVGVLTYLHPLPANKALYWHVMGSNIHMTMEITPNEPGKNLFYVQVWLPENQPKPKSVHLALTDESDADLGAIAVPIAESPADYDPNVYSGFLSYTYTATGPYLPFAGKWGIEVTVMDANDNETQYDQVIRIY